MAKPVLTNAEEFSFTTTRGEVLELFGAVSTWVTDSKPGLASFGILKRAGALHQVTGTEPRRFVYSCTIQGADVTARFRRLLAVLEADPFGRLVDPRLGSTDAVWEGTQASEDAGEALDLIAFSIRFTETGLRDAPRPTPTAQAQAAQSQAATAQTESAPSGGAIAAAGAEVYARTSGLLLAMSQAETGLGSLLDVDASLAALSNAQRQLDALGAPQPARDAAARALAFDLHSDASHTTTFTSRLPERIGSDPIGTIGTNRVLPARGEAPVARRRFPGGSPESGISVLPRSAAPEQRSQDRIHVAAGARVLSVVSCRPGDGLSGRPLGPVPGTTTAAAGPGAAEPGAINLGCAFV